MAKSRSNHISTFGSQLTATISVALSLLILGVLALLLFAGQLGSDTLRNNLGFIIKIERQAGDSDVNRIKQLLNSSDYVSSYVFASAEEIMAAESESLGDDIASLLDVNPYGAEFDVKLKPEWARADSIDAIQSRLCDDDAIETVLTESAMIEAVNQAIDRISWVLLVVAVVLLVISVVLINNTVHLSVYSRRFVIHTMKLVGATGAFIRRPFLLAGAINGAVAALLASVLLICSLLYLKRFDSFVASCFSFKLCGAIILILFVCGVTICVLASLFATNRYLRATYDDMFQQ